MSADGSASSRDHAAQHAGHIARPAVGMGEPAPVHAKEIVPHCRDPASPRFSAWAIGPASVAGARTRLAFLVGIAVAVSFTVDESVTGCDGSWHKRFPRFFVVILPV